MSKHLILKRFVKVIEIEINSFILQQMLKDLFAKNGIRYFMACQSYKIVFNWTPVTAGYYCPTLILKYDLLVDF